MFTSIGHCSLRALVLIKLEGAWLKLRRDIRYHSLGKSIVELTWPDPVKYDAVRKFVATHTLVEDFSVHAQIPPACGSQSVQTVGGPAVGTDDASRQGAASSVQIVAGSVAGANGASRQGAASSVQVVAGLTTSVPVPARCMALKLACVVDASDGELCSPTFTVKWKKNLEVEPLVRCLKDCNTVRVSHSL